MTKIPRDLARAYGGARAYRKLKRAQLAEAKEAISKLGIGSAFFPCGPAPIDEVWELLNRIEHSLSAKVWGK